MQSQANNIVQPSPDSQGTPQGTSQAPVQGPQVAPQGTSQAPRLVSFRPGLQLRATQRTMPMQQMPLTQMPMQQMPMMDLYNSSLFMPVGRVPLIHPKGYVRKAGVAAVPGVPQPKDMIRSAVRFISPAEYHPGEPGKNLSPNVISVELGALSRSVELATGDPIRCKQCNAIFCASDAACLAKAEKKDDGEDEEMVARVWTCRYCGCKQEIEVDDAEIPKSSVSEYVLAPGEEPASSEEEKSAAAAGKEADEDDCFVVFCVDVSGSMTVTSHVADKHVSKLACVAEAVYSQMDALRHEHPNRRVCLITFGNDVDVFDGENHHASSGVALYDWDKIVKFAEGIAVEKPISTVFDALADEVIYMSDRGCTALGPALLTSISIASRKRGSYVVLCTDGMANQGIGSLEGLREKIDKEKDETKKSEVELLYERFGTTAKDAGVTVSVIGIKGAECSLENLGAVADASGGNVELADPTHLDFGGAIEEPVLVTNAKVTVRIEPAFVFENGANSETNDIGNVKAQTQQMYSLFSAPDDKVKPSSEVRMQCEVSFTMNNGALHLRVVERVIPFNESVREAVDEIDIRLVGGYVSRQAATLAHDGEVEAAGLLSQGYQDKLREIMSMQRRATATQVSMMDRFTANNVCAQQMVMSSIATQRRTGRTNLQQSRARSDEESASIYQMRNDKAECMIM